MSNITNPHGLSWDHIECSPSIGDIYTIIFSPGSRLYFLVEDMHYVNKCNIMYFSGNLYYDEELKKPTGVSKWLEEKELPIENFVNHINEEQIERLSMTKSKKDFPKVGKRLEIDHRKLAKYIEDNKKDLSEEELKRLKDIRRIAALGSDFVISKKARFLEDYDSYFIEINTKNGNHGPWTINGDLFLKIWKQYEK